MAADLAAKLTLILDALAISRGRLAVHLQVDKSAVSRWCSGTHMPSDDNLGKVTRLVASYVPGFTGLDWEADIAELRARLTSPGTSATPGLYPGAKEARRETARIGHMFEGHWDEWRPTFTRRGQFALDIVWIRRDGDYLAFTAVNGEMRSGRVVDAGQRQGDDHLPASLFRHSRLHHRLYARRAPGGGDGRAGHYRDASGVARDRRDAIAVRPPR